MKQGGRIRKHKEEGAMAFVVLKSYDGGKHWELAQEYNDYASASNAAQALGVKHPSIRFRVDVKTVRLHRVTRKVVRSKRRQR